jgi:hypothetical protein
MKTIPKTATNKNSATANAPIRKSITAPSFRYVFSNSFAMEFGDNDVKFTFGHGREEFVEEVCVFMTPRSAKIMMLSLKATIEKFEAEAMEIPVPSGCLSEPQ